MHLFAICSWIYSFLYIAYLLVLRLLGTKSRNGTTDFRSADRLLFIIIKDPLYFLFSSFRILGPHWAEREVKPAGKTSAFPKRLSVLPLFFYFSVLTPTCFYQRFFYSKVCCLCLVTAAENVSVQLVFWSLGPLSKTCPLQKRLPLSAVKAMVIFHVRFDRWHLLVKNSTPSAEQQSLRFFFFP